MSQGPLPVKTRQHQWVKHIVVPVDVVQDPFTNEPQIITDHTKFDAAVENGVHGCAACSAVLDQQSITTPCPGFDDQL